MVVTSNTCRASEYCRRRACAASGGDIQAVFAAAFGCDRDPFLGHELVQPVIKGIQDNNVVANAKHCEISNCLLLI